MTKMVGGFVISLARRPERFKSFQETFGNSRIVIELLPGIDGRKVSVEQYLQRINPWFLKFGNEKTIRGVVGCKLSHEQVWRRIAELEDGLYFVFEDDAVATSQWILPQLNKLRDSAPDDADLIWLNAQYVYEQFGASAFIRKLSDNVSGPLRIGGRISALWRQALARIGTLRFRRWAPIQLSTAEAYLLRPSYAAKLLEYTKDWTDSIDGQMKSAVENIGGHAYYLFPPAFGQSQKFESDIQI